MKVISGGITAAKGFLASGVSCGIKSSGKKDLALIFSLTPAKAAASFTTNKMAAAPIIVSKKHVKSGTAQAVVINSGNANSCTGKGGIKDAIEMARVAASELGISPYEVVVASTGLIGVPLPMEKIKEGIKKAKAALRREGSADASKAIMTTDTKTKELAIEFDIGGKKVVLGGIAKGSGMIGPQMEVLDGNFSSVSHATMLAFLTTDADIENNCLKNCLKRAVDRSFNMITVDGEVSTNDMVVVLANGQAKAPLIVEGREEEKIFQKALNFVTEELAKMIVKDGEGATKFIEITVKGASTEKDAKKIAKRVAESPLVKTAFFGEDFNWGRIISAAGAADARIDPMLIELYLGEEKILDMGEPLLYCARTVEDLIKKKEIKVLLDLNLGNFEATCWTCDLSYDYVKINAEYRT